MRFRNILKKKKKKNIFDNTFIDKIDQIIFNQGVILSNINKNNDSNNIRDHEFKVFSQWGEDGIIQYLIKSVNIKNNTFIEFGVEDFIESNCRFLLQKDNWRGFVIDGSKENIERIKNSKFYWMYDLVAFNAWITKDNINDILKKSGFDEDVGILSIDIDGNDYYILEAIIAIRPRIIICEFNAIFGNSRKISTPYDPHFNRTKMHYSNLYFGASLPALVFLCEKLGYTLVGTNSTSSNAFFIRNDLMTEKLIKCTVEAAFTESHVRESRDLDGNLTYITGDKRLDLIRGLPVYNVEAGIIELL